MDPVPEIFKGKIVCKCCINKRNIKLKITEIITDKSTDKPSHKQVDNTKLSS